LADFLPLSSWANQPEQIRRSHFSIRCRTRPGARCCASGTHQSASCRFAWSPGRRNEDISRAAAAWLARRRFGYKVGEIANALGYAGHGGTVTAIRRIEGDLERTGKTLQRLERCLIND